MDRAGFDREQALFPKTVIAFIREAQPKEWAKLDALPGEKTGEQILSDLCKWMDVNGSLATLRHGFKCPDFEPIVLTGADEGQLQVIAEVL